MESSPTIEGLEAAAYTVPTGAPESDGTLTWDATTVVVVEARAGGTVGLGFTYAAPACVRVVADHLAGAVEGTGALDVPRSWEAMVRAVRNVGRPGIAAEAIAAVDVALWDLKAKLLGQPLAVLLGRCRDSVPVYGSGGFTSLDDDELARQLTGWAGDLAIPRVKIKVGEAWGSRPARDLERARLARRTIGDEVELYVDANGGYQPKQAVRMAAAYADLGVTWFEEPVSSDDLPVLAAIRRQTPIDVAAGEYGYDLHYFQRMCAAGAVDCLQADASRCAGVTEWLRVAAVAAAHGLEVSAHCAPLLHLHVACAVPNVRHLEYFADHTRLDRMLFDGVAMPEGGMLEPDWSRPGIGLELRRADAEQYRVA